MYELILSQPQTPLLYEHNHRIWQMAFHYKQWTKHHLKKLTQLEVRHITQSNLN